MSAPALDRRSDYVSAVAVELGDLAPDDRAELIEELDDHVAALLDDRPGTDLVGELGTPRAYAAELRAAAGLTGAGPTPVPLRTRAREFVRHVDARVPARLRPYLAALRPAWWVFRGYALLAAVSHVLGFSWSGSGLGVLIPAPAGLWGVGVLLTLAAAAVSVRLGSWTPRGGLQRAALIGLNVVAVCGALVVAGGARYVADGGGTYYDTQYVPNCPIELSNLYGYDAQGKPLDGVRLYDQNGNPFDLTLFGCNGGQFAPDGAPNVYPYPTAPVYDYGSEPTGPPSSLAPLPGATVSGATVSPGGTPGGSATPTPTPTPTG